MSKEAFGIIVGCVTDIRSWFQAENKLQVWIVLINVSLQFSNLSKTCRLHVASPPDELVSCLTN